MALLKALRCALVLMVAFPVIWPHAEVRGQTLTQEEALELAFSGADSIVRRTAYLDQADLERAGQLAGEEARPDASVLSYYVALRGTQPMGVAYFDAHRVRTLPEILMVVVDPEARIRRIEVVRFSEPPEYRPPEGWLEPFEDRSLDADLAHKRAIPNMTGATLTARAATLATRRVLALHAVIEPFLEWDG